jgi:FSR family fosmidomycin resistance protein-like MFS transporter
MSATRELTEPETTEPAGSAPPKFDTVAVSTLSFSHFVHDTYPAFLGTLLPLLIPKLGLTLGAAAALASVLRWSAVIQPFLGAWADRTDVRYWVILAPTITALGMSLLGLAPNYLAVILLLILTGLSHAAFHPAATALVTRSSGHSWGKGTSFFMTGGELGRALGPLYIVACVEAFGLEGSWVAVAPAVLASLLLYWRIGRAPRLALPSKGRGLWTAIKKVRRTLVVLSAVIVFRNLANSSFVLFLPTYLTGIGGSLQFAGLAISVFELAGAAGAFVGGTLSDRLGRRKILIAGQLVAGPALFGALALADGPSQLALLVLAGFASLSGGPVQLVLIQELLPENRSAAAGIMMFLGIEGTVLTTMSVGFLADIFGLGPALTWSVILSVFSIPFVLLLPETRRAR